MQELEELLATMKSCRCQEVPHPGSRENPIEVSTVVEPVCTCGPEIPPQIASDSEGSTLIENEDPIPVPGPVTTGQRAVRSSPRDSSPARHTHTIYHPYCRHYGSEPLGRQRKTPRPGLEGRSGKVMERGVSVAL